MREPSMEQLEAANAIVYSLYQPKNELLLRGCFYYNISEPKNHSRLTETNRLLGQIGWEARFVGADDFPHLLVKMKEKTSFPYLPATLFVATVLSVIFFPPFLQYGTRIFKDFNLVRENLPFATALLAILVFHEAGHFFAAKRLGAEVSLPYFIPGPTLFGTFGAVIRANSPFFNRRDLMEIAAAGPIAGLLIAIPAFIYGLMTSKFVPMTGQGLELGDSLLTWILTKILWSDIPKGYTVMISPLGFAGWAGLLVTMLNLLPIGSLDGGHISYALFGKTQKKVAYLFWLSLLPLGFWFYGWWVWAAIGFFLRLQHPPTLDDSYPLTTFHKALGWICLLIFILIFIPIPLT